MQTTLNSTTSGNSKDTLAGYAASANPRAASESHFDNVVNKTKQSVREIADEGKAAATEQVNSAARWVRNATHDNPLRVLGIAAAAGIALGVLIGRR